MMNRDKRILMPQLFRPGEWEQLIFDADGCACGRFRAAIRHNEQDLRHSFNLTQLGGFQRYAPHIAAPQFWPMAVLDRIDINKDRQRMGYGRKGLEEFYKQAVSRG